jgi:hypothetical protein
MSPHNLDYDSASSSGTEKPCKGCGCVRPMTAYSIDASRSDRLRAKCKECCALEHQAWRATKSRDAAEPAAKRPKLEPTIPGEHLYVMALSTDPLGLLSGLKVGRSGNIGRRAHELGNSMPFHLLVLATFPGQGHLEDLVHSLLASDRNGSGRGREWFHAPLPEILQAVSQAMQAHAKVNGARAAEQHTGSPWNCPAVAGSFKRLSLRRARRFLNPSMLGG